MEIWVPVVIGAIALTFTTTWLALDARRHQRGLVQNLRRREAELAAALGDAGADPEPEAGADPDALKMSEADVRRCVERAVDAALGEVARQQAGIAGQIALEARSIGIDAAMPWITALGGSAWVSDLRSRRLAQDLRRLEVERDALDRQLVMTVEQHAEALARRDAQAQLLADRVAGLEAALAQRNAHVAHVASPPSKEALELLMEYSRGLRALRTITPRAGEYLDWLNEQIRRCEAVITAPDQGVPHA